MLRSLNTALYLILNGLPSSAQIKKNGRYVDSVGLDHIRTSEQL